MNKVRRDFVHYAMQHRATIKRARRRLTDRQREAIIEQVMGETARARRRKRLWFTAAYVVAFVLIGRLQGWL